MNPSSSTSCNLIIFIPQKINSIWTIRSPGVIFSLGSKRLVSRVLGVWSQLRSSNFKISRFGIYRFFANYPYLFFRICPPSLEPFFEHLEPSPSGSDHTTRSAIDFYAKNRKSAPWRAPPPRNPPRIFSTFNPLRGPRKTKKPRLRLFKKNVEKMRGGFGGFVAAVVVWVDPERIPSLIDRRPIASTLSIEWVAGQIRFCLWRCAGGSLYPGFFVVALYGGGSK